MMLVQPGHIVDRNIFAFKKPREKHLLLNDIKDEAKGTGKWTSQAAIYSILGFNSPTLASK